MSGFRTIVENILREGDKKIFDKDSGYNVSEDENVYYDLIKKKWQTKSKQYMSNIHLLKMLEV